MSHISIVLATLGQTRCIHIGLPWLWQRFHACDKDLNYLINRLEHGTLLVIEWFGNNNIKLNQGKYHLIISGHKYENEFAFVGQSIIWDTFNQNLLGIIKDRKVKWLDYVTSICKKAGQNYLCYLGCPITWLLNKDTFFWKHLQNLKLVIAI